MKSQMIKFKIKIFKIDFPAEAGSRLAGKI